MLDQNQRIFAEIFRTSSLWNLKTFNRTSGLQDSLALALQKLQVFGRWRRSSELPVFRIFSTCSEAQSSEAGTVHQNFLSQSLQKLLGKSSEFADADDLLIRTTSSEAL